MTGNNLPRTYMEHFCNPAANPFGQGADQRRVLIPVYHNWRAADAPPSATTLFNKVVDNFEGLPVGGIGIFVRDPDGTDRLRILHGLRRYVGVFGTASPLAGNIFGYLDDITQGVGEIVQLTEALFGLTGTINVCTVAHHKRTLEADENIHQVPARGNDEAQTEAIRARISGFIPFDFMPLLLGKNFTARQAFLVIEAHLASNGFAVECAPLLDFLRVASTKNSTGVILNSLMEPGPNFRLEVNLTLDMMAKVLHRDLPALRVVAPRLDPATAALTAAVQTLTDQHLRTDAANAKRKDEDDKPKTIPDAFGEDITCKLLLFCQKESDDELPILYNNIANKKSRQTVLTIMQHAIDAAAEDLGTGAPIVTPAVMAFVNTFRFQGTDDSDVGSGVLPMSFVPPGAATSKARARRTEDQELAFTYMNMMATAGQQITSADAKALSKSKGYVVTKWSEVYVQLRGYLPVLATIIGNNHPLFLAYQRGVEAYHRDSLQYHEALDEEVGELLAPALLVYMFQIKLRAWFEEQWSASDSCPVPDFAEPFRRFKYEKHLQGLPTYSAIPELCCLAPKPDSSVPWSGGGSSNPASSKKKTETSTGATQTRISNNAWNKGFQENNEFCKRIKNWKVLDAIKAMKKKGKSTPVTSHGKERCVTFHVKGYCFSDCKNSHDHQHLNTEEKTAFFSWCQEAYA